MISGVIKPLIPAGTKSVPSLRQFADAMRKASPSLAMALERTQQALDVHDKALRSQPEQADEFVFTDAEGKMIAWLGSRDGYWGGWFGQLYVGATGPEDAPFFIDDEGVVSIGKNGFVQLLDPGGNPVGWIGCAVDAAQSVTSATNATPVVIGKTAHGYENGDTVHILGATGNTAINGYRLVKNKTANTFEITDLDGVDVAGDGTFAGAATMQRYFGGGLFETLAIGSTFTDYKLRAFADGSLKINDALITLTGETSIITLDPATGAITITPNPTTGRALTLNAQKIELVDRDGQAVFRIIDNERPAEGLPPLPTEGCVIWTDTGAGAVYALEVKASGAAGAGAALRIAGLNGTKAVPTATAVGDYLGTIVFDGYLSGQCYIRAKQKSANDTEMLLSTTTSGFSYTRAKVNELGVEIPNPMSIYLHGLTGTRPLKLDANNRATAELINVGSANDIAASGFSSGDFAKWDGTKFVPVSISSLASALSTYFAAANHTHSVSGSTSESGDPSHSHTVDGGTGTPE